MLRPILPPGAQSSQGTLMDEVGDTISTKSCYRQAVLRRHSPPPLSPHARAYQDPHTNPLATTLLCNTSITLCVSLYCVSAIPHLTYGCTELWISVSSTTENVNRVICMAGFGANLCAGGRGPYFGQQLALLPKQEVRSAPALRLQDHTLCI